VAGHEYAETVTDQDPGGGWTDSLGFENGDKCAWIGTGGPGGAQDVTFSTGSFAMQGTWSNDANGCQISHPVLADGLVNGGFDTGTLTGWSVSGRTSMVTVPFAFQGTFAAELGNDSPTTTSSIAQTFTAPSGSSTLIFAYQIFCPDTVEFDWATATLLDNSNGTTVTVLPKTCNPVGSGWKTASAPVTPGHNYTLTLANHDDDYAEDPTYTWFDAVSIG
jgi:hypothetical protein